MGEFEEGLKKLNEGLAKLEEINRKVHRLEHAVEDLELNLEEKFDNLLVDVNRILEILENSIVTIKKINKKPIE